MLIAAGWFAPRLVLGPTVSADRIIRGGIVETVVASGHVETPFRVPIGSQITGTVKTVLVLEGQAVTKGQPLIALEDAELRATADMAKAALAQAEAKLAQFGVLTLPTARASLTQAQATLLNAQQVYSRAADLARDGFATRVDLDAAKKDLDVARTQLGSATLQVTTASPGGSDVVLAETALTQARASLATDLARLGYASIAAPRDGVLITRDVEQGSVVAPGTPLMVLAPSGETQLVLELDERNLSKVAIGQTAIASADAYPAQKFNATLVYINPGVDITKASVEVKLNAIAPPAFLVQDMTVSVDIVVAQRDSTLILPTRSVREALSPAPWILAAQNGRAVRLPVHLGIQGLDRTEILSGADENTLVIPASAAIAPGARLRAVSPPSQNPK